MALVNAKEMMAAAEKGHYAVGAFNINNMEWIKGILAGAQAKNSPVMLGVSEGAGKYMCGFKTVVAMVTEIIENMGITVPVALHLDHGTYEGSKAALAAGFTSVMFDGSKYGIEENIEKTKEIVKLAHSMGCTVEAEVGAIGGEEDGVSGNAGEHADPKECKMIADLDVDILAAGIGNIHGQYPEGWPGLDFDCLSSIKDVCGHMPLVLHGGTGIPAEMVQHAIDLGVCKVNVNTECQLAFAAATRGYIEANLDDPKVNKKGYDPRKLLKPGTDAIAQTVMDKIDIFGSANRA